MNKYFGPMMLFCFFTQLVVFAEGEQVNRPPQITHAPVTKALRGQPITLKATVKDDRNEIEAVTLYYTLSADAAPFRLTMRNAGLGVYLGTIDAGVAAGVHLFSYYIEAQDSWGATTETPWYPVEIRDPKTTDEKQAAAATAPTASSSAESESDLTVPLSVIAGSAVAVVGGAILLSDSGGGGSSSSSSDTNDLAAMSGTYNGSVTTCFTPDGGSPSCESHSMSIAIDINGTVLSDTLLEGEQMVGGMSGNDFTLTSSVNDEGETGEIIFSGTVINNERIVGSISGSSIGGAVGPGSYSGSFTADK